MRSIKHLLVIRLSAMGDVAMTIPVLLALQKQYPEVKITVLTRSFFKPIFDDLPNVVVYAAEVKSKHKGVIGLWRLYKELKVLKIDAVVDLHNVLRSNILKQFFRLGGYKFKQINKGRSEKKALIINKGGLIKPLKSTHQRYKDVFSKCGFLIDLPTDVSLEKRELSEHINELIFISNKKLIGIAPFAAFKGKMYPIDLMEQVISVLCTSNKYRVLLFGGGKKEQEQLEILENKYVNAISMIGKIQFSEELDIISNLDLMLAMDSGNAHLAAMFGIPTVTLWGVTHPYAGFYPFGQDANNALLADRTKFPLIPTSVYGNKLPEGYEDAMRTILPEDVILKIETIVTAL